MSSGKPHAQVAEDVAFMVEHGETNAEAIATRLGMSIEAVEKAMSRAILAGTSTPPWHDAKSTGWASPQEVVTWLTPPNQRG